MKGMMMHVLTTMSVFWKKVELMSHSSKAGEGTTLFVEQENV
jgi:hypothetical protein